MKYEEFCQHVRNGMYETIYDDSEGREILVIELLDAYDMFNKAPKRKWVGLTSVDWNDFNAVKSNDPQYAAAWAEAKLKEKNT